MSALEPAPDIQSVMALGAAEELGGMHLSPGSQPVEDIEVLAHAQKSQPGRSPMLMGNQQGAEDKKPGGASGGAEVAAFVEIDQVHPGRVAAGRARTRQVNTQGEGLGAGSEGTRPVVAGVASRRLAGVAGGACWSRKPEACWCRNLAVAGVAGGACWERQRAQRVLAPVTGHRMGKLKELGGWEAGKKEDEGGLKGDERGTKGD